MHKIIAAGTTFLIDPVVAAITGLFLLVAMNGYSERPATWGLATYGVAALGACCLAAFMASTLMRGYLQRAKSVFSGVFLSIAIGTSIGIGVIVVSSFIAVGVAEYVRSRH